MSSLPGIRKSAAKGVAKTVTRKPRAPRRQQSDSWELLDRRRSAEHADDEDGDYASDDQLAMQRSHLSTPPPEDPTPAPEAAELQLISDRVGKEVEIFAETLDKFYDEVTGQENVYDLAHDLVIEFKAIALQAAAELSKLCEQDLDEQDRREWNFDHRARVPADDRRWDVDSVAASHSTRDNGRPSPLVEEVRHYRQEAETWELFRIIIEMHYNFDTEAKAEEVKYELEELGNVHRYTPESQLFERFLLEDGLASQRHKIKSWLEETAEHKSDASNLVEKLQKQAGTGFSNMSRGYTHTRENIKGEKRLRTWPSPDSSPLPQIRRRDGDLLVTSLDPDAPARQGRLLETEDAAHERTIWIVIWTMLRRGMDWHLICKWCDERHEGWRAVLLEKGLANAESLSNVAWRRMCNAASRSNGVGDFEAAVYGLLGGGNIDAVNAVSRAVDDQLYAHFSAALTQQFDQYLRANYPDRIPRVLSQNTLASAGVISAEQAQNDINDLIYSLRTKQSTKNEATLPLKILQSYLLANEADSFVHTLGSTIADVALLDGETETLAERVKESQYPEASLLANPHGLRIAAHVCLVLQVLREDKLTLEDADIEDNIVEAYIQALRSVGKRDLTPLYASRLQRPRYIMAQAHVLEDVHKGSEMNEMINLMTLRGMDVIAILNEQFTWILRLQSLSDRSTTPIKFSILEDTAVELFPSRAIKLNAILSDVGEYGEKLVQSLAWYTQVKGYWKDTFRVLTQALRTALVHGRFALANAIIEKYSGAVVTAQKSHEIFGKFYNFDSEEGPIPEDPTQRARYNIMFRQCRVYFQLEELVAAIAALTDYRDLEHEFATEAPKLTSAPKSLKEASIIVDDNMAPLLQKPFLVESADEAEAADLAIIRRVYLPEAIIGYLTILHSSAAVISRSALLQAMDVPIAVAKDELMLTAPFVESGRMGELMDILARCSKALIISQQSGRRPIKDRGHGTARLGRDAKIWELPRRHIIEENVGDA